MTDCWRLNPAHGAYRHPFAGHGARVTEFENRIAEFTGSGRAVATMNGTAALHMALIVAGVRPGDEVISQALTFVATCNALSYVNARPVFMDVDKETMGMSPVILRRWLETNTRREGGETINRETGARVAACVPMHTFGLPCRREPYWHRRHTGHAKLQRQQGHHHRRRRNDRHR